MGSWYGNIWNGAFDVADGLGSFSSDLVSAGSDLVKGDFTSAADVVVGSVQEDLLGKTMLGLFGPEGIGGTIIGALPEEVRNPARTIINPVFGVMNFALEEVVDRPLGTAATLLNVGLTNPGSLLDLSTYARAYAINDERTVGQSAMAAAYLIDPFDQEEFQGLQDKPIFNLFSGTMDFAAEFLDPVAWSGAFAVKAARGAAVAGAVRGGEVVSTYGRRFSNSTRLSSGRRLSVRPDENYVLGPGMGVRKATIGGRGRIGDPRQKALPRVLQPLVATTEQVEKRRRVVQAFIDERSANFVKSQKFRDMNNAVQSGTTATERASIATVWMGPAASKFGASNVLRWATGETAEARELSMRVMMGDSTAHIQAIEVAKEIRLIQESEEWAEAVQYRNLAFGKQQDISEGATGELTMVNKQTGEVTPVSPKARELSKQYDELVAKVDWSLLHQTNQALKAALPKQLVIDPETGLYIVKETVDQTLASVDNGIAVQAIEDLLGRADPDGKYTNSIFLQTGQVRNLPYGARISGIFEEHLKFLDETDKEAAVTTYVDPNTFGGNSPIVRFITERVNRARIYFHDSGSTTDVQRTLRDATRINIPDADPLLTPEEAGRLVQEYELLRSQGRIAEAQMLFLNEVRRINRLLDQHLEQYHLDSGFAYERHIVDVWEEANAKHTGRNPDGTVRNDKRQTRISLQDSNGNITRTAFIDEGNGLNTQEITVAMARVSPRQLERSAVLPRYDLVQKNIELINKRRSPSRRVRVQTKAGDYFRLGSRKVGDVTKQPMVYWRAGVLLNPKWPMRITMEEQLRMATQLGTLAVAANFFAGIGELRRSYAFHNFPAAEMLTDHRLLEAEIRSRYAPDRQDAVRKRLAEIEKELEIADQIPGPAGDRAIKKLDSEKIQLESQFEDVSLVEIMNDLGTEGFEEIVEDITRQKVLTRRALRRTRANSALKAVGIGALFTNPLVGGLYGYISFHRKSKRMMQASQRSAAFTMQASLRARARQMLLANPDDRAAYMAAMDVMSEADYIKKLVDEEEAFASIAGELDEASAEPVANAFDIADELLEKSGFGNLQIGGQAFRSGFGDDPRFSAQIQREVSANQHASTLLRGSQENVARDLAESGQADFIVTDLKNVKSDEFAPLWEQMLNRMTSPSVTNEFFNIVWSNESVQERVARLSQLLDEDPNLFHTLISDTRSEFVAGVDTELIAEFIVEEYEQVLPHVAFPDLRDDLRNGVEVKWSDVESRITVGGDTESLPRQIDGIRGEDYPHFAQALHPETIDVPTGIGQQIDNYIEEFFRLFGTLPSDELSRFPFYKATYDVEMRRLTYQMLDEDGMLRISQNQMNDLERQAREYALAETRDVLFELSESSRLGEVMGNASPFFSAYQEVIGRWAGFAADNPFFIAKTGDIYRQPWDAEALGLQQVTVGEGEQEATYVVFRPFGDAWDQDGNKTTIFEAMPESIRSLFIPAAMRDAEAPLRFSKNGFNTIAQGAPGFGPLVTVPVREVMNVEPELETTLKFMFPFGHPHGDFFTRTRIALMPAWSKNAENLLRDTHTSETVVNRMFRDLTIQMAEAGDPLDWNDELQVMAVLEEAEKRTENFFMFRIFAGLFSPTSTTVLSPYDSLVQEYRNLEQEFGYRQAQTVFLDKYGTDFFALTGRMSQLNDGVATTVESEALYMDNQALVQAHPEIGAWITGSVGTFDEVATFSQVVYNRQFAEPVGPGAQETRREIKSPEDYVKDTQIQQGWNEYSALMSRVRILQDRSAAAGLSSALTANHMADVKDFKDRVLADISARFPAWREEFDDFGSSRQRLIAVYDGFASALQVPSILERPSTKHVLEFIELRLSTQALLEDRAEIGYSNNINARDNADIKLFWEEAKEEMGGRPDFEAIYDRYFARDNLEPATFIDLDDFPVLRSVVRY